MVKTAYVKLSSNNADKIRLHQELWEMYLDEVRIWAECLPRSAEEATIREVDDLIQKIWDPMWLGGGNHAYLVILDANMLAFKSEVLPEHPPFWDLVRGLREL